MDIVKERYKLICGRIKDIVKEAKTKDKKDNVYYKAFGCIAKQYVGAIKLYELLNKKDEFEKKSFEELQKFYEKLYKNIKPENYKDSFENPEYAVKLLGSKTGKLVSMLAMDSYVAFADAAEGNIESFTMMMELFVEIFCIYESALTSFMPEAALETAYKEAGNAYKSFKKDTLAYFERENIYQRYNPEYTFFTDILRTDLTDLRYLYRYGEYITDNEIETAKFWNSMPEKKVKACADTYVDGYLRGFKTMNANFKDNGIVSLFYPVGFERMVYYAMKRFEEMGQKTVAERAFLRGRSSRSSAVMPTNLNGQFIYDHRNDAAFYFDKVYFDKRFEATKKIVEDNKELLALQNGPAVIECFGEPDFNPVNKKDAYKFTARQKTLKVEFGQKYGMLMEKYIPEEETSFTIIAFPLPSIGKDFKKIFDETVKINNLDNAEYIEIQSHIIDTLDKGTSVFIKGTNGNETNLTVQLWKLKNPKKETIFENCTADVNIPVGEVFTSPVLKGTNGLLHVSKVFLNGMEYKNLKIWFKDGCTEKYSCDNFSTEKENIDFLKEYLLHNRDFLPLGEFAIGTNTTAFAMGVKYDITRKLPILIAEKTGPHFAVGDTCYSYAEDHKVYNPDGKEIVARENELSALREKEPEKAYFNCHTDITIPYDEIGEISAVKADGSKTAVIRNGRFVLKGTEALNIPLDKQ